MSNHFSAANLKHPGDDARLDLTDLFVFAAPDHPDRTVLIMNANPFTNGDGFHPMRSTGSTSTTTGTRWPTWRSASPSPNPTTTAGRPPPPPRPPAATPRPVNHVVKS
jgi:hypothetical protein